MVREQIQTSPDYGKASCMNATQEFDNKGVEMNLPAQLGRVWLSEKGEVVGVLFSTRRGDILEIRGGNGPGFIRMDRLGKAGAENLSGKGLVRNAGIQPGLQNPIN